MRQVREQHRALQKAAITMPTFTTPLMLAERAPSRPQLQDSEVRYAANMRPNSGSLCPTVPPLTPFCVPCPVQVLRAPPPDEEQTVMVTRSSAYDWLQREEVSWRAAYGDLAGDGEESSDETAETIVDKVNSESDKGSPSIDKGSSHAEAAWSPTSSRPRPTARLLLRLQRFGSATWSYPKKLMAYRRLRQ